MSCDKKRAREVQVVCCFVGLILHAQVMLLLLSGIVVAAAAGLALGFGGPKPDLVCGP